MLDSSSNTLIVLSKIDIISFVPVYSFSCTSDIALSKSSVKPSEFDDSTAYLVSSGTCSEIDLKLSIHRLSPFMSYSYIEYDISNPITTSKSVVIPSSLLSSSPNREKPFFSCIALYNTFSSVNELVSIMFSLFSISLSFSAKAAVRLINIQKVNINDIILFICFLLSYSSTLLPVKLNAFLSTYPLASPIPTTIFTFLFPVLGSA